ncbi:MAG: acetyl-CoA synthetase, partial [Porticoccaceae bacterium]
MPDVKLYTVPESWAKTAWINKENYQEMYRESVDDPEKFWAKQATEFLT